jgi:hypothetical protein
MIVIRGHLGFGDCIHQRAIVRDLMDSGEQVVLETFYTALYHDLVARDLRLHGIVGHPARVREQAGALRAGASVPHGAKHVRLRYDATTVHQHGSILAGIICEHSRHVPRRQRGQSRGLWRTYRWA